MVKAKVRYVFYLPRRLYRVLEDITPLFEDKEAIDPQRGAMTRALEYILQNFMESEDYLKKKEMAAHLIQTHWHIFNYIHKKEMELQETLRKNRDS